MLLEGLGVAFITVSVGLNAAVCFLYGPRVYAVLKLPATKAPAYARTPVDDVLDASI